MDAKLYLTYRCHQDCPHCLKRAEGLTMPREVGQRAIELVLDHTEEEEKRALYRNYSPRGKMPCQRCVLRDICFHECVAVNFQGTGDLYRTPWVVCEREKVLIAQADRMGNLLYRERNPIFMRRFYGWTVEEER